MLTIAYLANEFPVAVEPYVPDEIRELRRRGMAVIACSVRQPKDAPEQLDSGILYLMPFRLSLLVGACLLCVCRFPIVLEFLHSALTEAQESFQRRFKAIVHTFLGVYYALLLEKRSVEHIHVHHGYFASWIAVVAARLLGVGFSMTLHGSDLLLHHAFLNVKLKRCKFCLTVSDFNRQHILNNYPEISPEKIRVQRMGVDIFNIPSQISEAQQASSCLIMLSVGRLHQVKDHAFLLRCCKQLKDRGDHFLCLIAGEGPERSNLEKLIRDLDLSEQVTLLGHLSREKLQSYYSICDLVVLTSQSEGIPLVLMEAMAHGRMVLAPAITGIPELVVDGKTGFLYRPGSIDDFVSRFEQINRTRSALENVRNRARHHILEHFNRTKNLATFAELFPALILGSANHENSLLQ